MLKVLFRTDKETQETQIVGQTTKEGKDLDNIKRTLANDGGDVIKDKDDNFKSSSFFVESFDKDTVVKAFLDDE